MREQTLDGHLGRTVVVDLCVPCQSFWFDERESLSLTPGSTLSLFRIIGEHTAPPHLPAGDTAKCPRCRSRLLRTYDMQRATKFDYLRCPHGHGRLTTFFSFLREKDFIRPLTPQQVAEFRRNVQTINCSNCGGPVDLTQGAVCAHCGSPLSMLNLQQAEALVAQLRQADRSGDAIDPALPMRLENARREVEASFTAFERDSQWSRNISSAGLVGAGLSVVARWMRRLD
jgi:DNA-directed RNA polymerase subunit RPC12/RpoP